MARWPTYHLHICEFVGDQGTSRFPSKLFASPQTTLATPGAPTSEHPADLDQRFGPIEVHFVRVRRRAPRHPMENLGNETYGRFQEVDTFEVEPARDEWSDSEVQHDVRIAFGIVHLFRLLGAFVAVAVGIGLVGAGLVIPLAGATGGAAQSTAGPGRRRT